MTNVELLIKFYKLLFLLLLLISYCVTKNFYV